MKITHDGLPRNRIGQVILDEYDIQDGESYDDGHKDYIWRRVGNDLQAKSKPPNE